MIPKEAFLAIGLLKIIHDERTYQDCEVLEQLLGPALENIFMKSR